MGPGDVRTFFLFGIFFLGGSFTSHEDAFGFKYNVDALPSFYEVSESAVVEDGSSAKNRDHGGVGPIPPIPIPWNVKHILKQMI